MFLEMIKIAFRSIIAHKLRSFLVAFGVTIGVIAVVGMTALALSLQAEMKKQLSQMGPDSFVVMRVSPLNFLKGRDMKKMRDLWRRPRILLSYHKPLIEQSEFCEKIAPMSSYYGKVSFGKKRFTNASIVATTPEYNGLTTQKVEFGRFLSKHEIEHRKYICVIGPTIAKELFGDADPIGRRIKVRGIPFIVTGITKSLGKSIGQDKDNIIFVPITTALHHWKGRWNIQYLVKAKPGKVKEAQEEVSLILRRLRSLKTYEDNNFDIFTSELLMTILNSILAAVYAVGLFITMISLVVAGIGIMNVMFVSVTERTKEIGIRKATGASPRIILLQFTLEAAFLALIGGLLGLLFLAGVFQVLSAIPKITASVNGADAGSGVLPFKLILHPSIVFLGVLFSTSAGVIFGYFPARKAAKLNPVDALRWE